MLIGVSGASPARIKNRDLREHGAPLARGRVVLGHLRHARGRVPAWAFFKHLWETLGAIDKVETMDFPMDDDFRLAEIPKGFHERNRGSLAGCVGALDGIAIKIRKPWLLDDACPMTLYC